MPSAETAFWLMKTEPDEFSIDDLQKKGVARWDGVRNYQARNYLRTMRQGDSVIIYHSSCAEPAAVGLATVVRAAYPDPTQFDPTSEYHDPKSPPADPRWSAVDVRHVRTFTAPVTLASMRLRTDLEGLILLRPGTRLSVTPVSATHAALLIRFGK